MRRPLSARPSRPKSAPRSGRAVSHRHAVEATPRARGAMNAGEQIGEAYRLRDVSGKSALDRSFAVALLTYPEGRAHGPWIAGLVWRHFDSTDSAQISVPSAQRSCVGR